MRGFDENGSGFRRHKYIVTSAIRQVCKWIRQRRRGYLDISSRDVSERRGNRGNIYAGLWRRWEISTEAELRENEDGGSREA